MRKYNGYKKQRRKDIVEWEKENIIRNRKEKKGGERENRM